MSTLRLTIQSRRQIAYSSLTYLLVGFNLRSPSQTSPTLHRLYFLLEFSEYTKVGQYAGSSQNILDGQEI